MQIWSYIIRNLGQKHNYIIQKVKYVYNQNGKKTFVESTLILSRRHIVIISNKEHFFKEIIIRNIKGYTLSDKFMSAVVELIYGDNQFEFNATIAFKTRKNVKSY